VNAEEDAAYKAFQAVNPSDAAKKVETGEAFLLKYPESRYKSPVYGSLTYAYLQAGNTQKDAGIRRKGNRVRYRTTSLRSRCSGRRCSNLAWQCIRSHCPAGAGQSRAIFQASHRNYANAPKPENLTDEAFTSAKNQTLAMAHSGLGLVYVRRGKNAEAIPELEQAVKIDPNPDHVNYYLLGMANKVTSHFDDSVAAFSKCATMAGPMQGTCKTQADDAKKLGATQLSAPKVSQAAVRAEFMQEDIRIADGAFEERLGYKFQQGSSSRGR